jgi:hypothetical protein
VTARASPAQALASACTAAGLNGEDAHVLHDRANTVCKLARQPIVARPRYAPEDPVMMSRLTASVQVTAWLNKLGFPAVRPLDIQQPVAAHGYLATLWHYLEATRPPWEDVTSLGRLLRQLHQLPRRHCAFLRQARSARYATTPGNAPGSPPPRDPGFSAAPQNQTASTRTRPGLSAAASSTATPTPTTSSTPDSRSPCPTGTP